MRRRDIDEPCLTRQLVNHQPLAVHRHTVHPRAQRIKHPLGRTVTGSFDRHAVSRV